MNNSRACQWKQSNIY